MSAVTFERQITTGDGVVVTVRVSIDEHYIVQGVDILRGQTIMNFTGPREASAILSCLGDIGRDIRRASGGG